MGAVELVEVWRGDLLESIHRGHAVVCDSAGQVVEAGADHPHRKEDEPDGEGDGYRRPAGDVPRSGG